MAQSLVQVFPSILSGDFGRLAEEVQRIGVSGADGIHIDIMDGHFVPNLTFGPRAVAAIRRATDLFLDVHLMIYHPFDMIEMFIESGADRITFHFEATEDVEETLHFIQRCGKQAGLAFSPDTSASMIPKYVPICDLVLIMSVNPGFGGQQFLPEVVEKIRLTKEVAHRLELNDLLIQVDGGINPETARICVEAGANVLVSGNYLFQQSSMEKGIQQLRHIQ